MALKLNSHLWRSRHGIFYFRIERGGKEHRRSLHTRDPDTARAYAYLFGAELMGIKTPKIAGFGLEVDLAAGKIKVSTDGTDQDAQNASDMVERLGIRERLEAATADLPASPGRRERVAPATPPSRVWTLSESIADYKVEEKDNKSENTWATYQSGFNKILKGLGSTTPAADINGERFVAWRMKALDGKQSPETSDKDLRAIRGFFDWAILRGRHPGPNPVEKRNIKGVILAEEIEKFEQPREAFDADDLEKIIPAVIAADKPCGFWIPLIMLHTGARPGEIAEMLLDDIKEEADGTLSMRIRKGKTVLSRRTIPLPDALKAAGLLDYIADVRRAVPAATYLFPHLVPQAKNGRWNDPSKAFGKMKKALGIVDSKDSYSFRHTWITMSDRVGMSVNAARVYTGHKPEGNAKSDAHIGYIGSFTFDELNTLVLTKIDFATWPGYTPPDIHYVPGRFDAVLTAPPRPKRKMARKKRAA